jgi:glycosyltransferase involved in cell wall biosynthesis
MKTPKVSVLIPNFNYAQYLPEALESVLSQEFQDFEVLISDDCSQDGSAKVIESYTARDGRIRAKIHSSNLGMVENWNWCLAEARGEYIKFLLADDKLADSRALTQFVHMLDANPSASLAASARVVRWEESEKQEVWSNFEKAGLYPGKEVIARCMDQQSNLIGEPTVTMFRKKDAGRGYSVKYRQLVDEEMWLHLLERGDFVYTTEPLCCFRKHSEQQTEKNKVDAVGSRENWRLFWEYHSKPYLPGRRYHFRMLATMYDVRRRREREPKVSEEDRVAEQELSAVIGALEFRTYWAARKLRRPLENLQLWLRKRRARRSSYLA